MKKYALIFIILIIINNSNEFDFDQFVQYYDYIVLILRGMSINGQELCGNLLHKEKQTLIPTFKELMEFLETYSKDDLWIFALTHPIILNVNSYCNLEQFENLLSILDNEEKIKEILSKLSNKLKDIIDFSVD